MLPPALVMLGTEHPRLELHVTELDPAEVPDALRSGLLDIALVHEYDYVPATRDPALDSQPLLAETVFLARAAGSPARPGTRGVGPPSGRQLASAVPCWPARTKRGSLAAPARCATS